MPVSPTTIRGRLAVAGKRNKTYPPDRRCADCATILSIYNPRETCRVHTPIKYPRPHGTRKR